jgi:hypothetical protein
MTDYIEQICYLIGLSIIPLQERVLSLQKERTALLFSEKKNFPIENACIVAGIWPFDQAFIII